MDGLTIQGHHRPVNGKCYPRSGIDVDFDQFCNLVMIIIITCLRNIFVQQN